MKKLLKKILPALLVAPLLLLAHGGESHESSLHSKQVIIVAPTDLEKEQYAQINTAYLTQIKPIFKAKCFDCHSTQTVYPWYSKIPGVKQMIEYDVREAKKHLDMTKGFPFISHETPIKDLKSIQEEIEEDEMPPLKYILGHWNARLTPIEKKIVSTWTTKSLQLLKGKTNEN